MTAVSAAVRRANHEAIKGAMPGTTRQLMDRTSLSRGVIDNFIQSGLETGAVIRHAPALCQRGRNSGAVYAMGAKPTTKSVAAPVTKHKTRWIGGRYPGVHHGQRPQEHLPTEAAGAAIRQSGLDDPGA